MNMRVINEQELKDRYISNMRSVTVMCRFDRNVMGGRPAGRDGIEQFVMHQLGLKETYTDDNGKEKQRITKEGEAAIARIINEEGKEKDITPETGEIKEKES